MIAGTGISARKAIWLVSVKKTAPTSSEPIRTWIRSLAPPLRKRSIWLMSSFRIAHQVAAAVALELRQLEFLHVP